MESPNAPIENDQLFCREQVARTHRDFPLSSAFAPPGLAQRLLPLYAMFSMIEQLCSSRMDEEIARSKLAWWRLEFLHKEPGQSTHPVIRELVRTGAAKNLSHEQIEILLSQAEYRLDAPHPADIEELKARCQLIYQPQAELEARVCGWSDGFIDWNPGWSARSGLLQLVRESSVGVGQGSLWWLPLNLLARYGVSRENVANASRPGPSADLLGEVIQSGREWGRQARPSSSAGPEDVPSIRHLYAVSGLHARKLKRLEALTPDRYGAEFGRPGLGAALAAWTSARIAGAGNQHARKR